MLNDPFSNAFKALNDAKVGYVAIGGFAVVMHGNSRFTPDLNVICDLDQADPNFLVSVLKKATLEPKTPEDETLLLDSAARETAISKGKLFSNWIDLQAPTFSLDFFLGHSMDVESLLKNALEVRIGRAMPIKVCGFDDLFDLKQKANRAQDKADLEVLNVLKECRDELTKMRLLKNPPPGFEGGRLENILTFSELPYEERLTWLVNILSELGSFCVL